MAEKRRLCRLTTIDNPIDPFEDYDKWSSMDCLLGWNTEQYLDRVANTSDILPDKANDEEIERAIDEIIKYNPLHIHRKVVKEIDYV